MPSNNKSKKTKTARTDYGQGWKQKKNEGYDLELPSGNIVLVRKPGVEELLARGILDSMDSLTSIVSHETIPKAEGKRVVDAAKLLAGDGAQFKKIMDQMNKVVLYCVMEPKLAPVPTQHDLDVWNEQNPDDRRHTTHEMRDPQVLYVDEVDVQDRSYIMQAGMGAQVDLAEFRKSTEEAVGSLHALEASADETE